MVKHRWPHMNQDPPYVTWPLMFDDLNFCQFVSGECRTILRTSDPVESTGRLKILSKIAYLYDQCGNWSRARGTYFAILGSIEEGEADWNSSFGYYDLMCALTLNDKQEMKQEKPSVQCSRQTKRDFFCKDYQRGECPLRIELT